MSDVTQLKQDKGTSNDDMAAELRLLADMVQAGAVVSIAYGYEVHNAPNRFWAIGLITHMLAEMTA